ncbi:MAG: hypothetical protein ABL958_06265 [Bdellovibrionia bacterium]
MKYLLLLLLIAGCSEEKSKYATVSKLRVVGLRTAVPEISPGGTISSVEALVLDPDGNGRPLTYQWAGCMEPLLEHAFDCEGAADRVDLGTGATSVGGVIVIPPTALDALPPFRAFNGINYLVVLKVDAGNESVKSFKRIVVSTNPAKNSNPDIISLARNGTVLGSPDAFVSGEFTLTSALSAGSSENYTYMDAQGSQKAGTEDILLTWFHTEGDMKTSRTFGGDLDNQWKIDSKSRTTISLVVVIHDGRGGSDWVQVDLQ